MTTHTIARFGERIYFAQQIPRIGGTLSATAANAVLFSLQARHIMASLHKWNAGCVCDTIPIMPYPSWESLGRI